MSFSRFERLKKSNLAVLLLFANFLKNSLITFLYFLYTASWGWYWSTVKRWISLNYSKSHFQGRKGQGYYSVETKCCPNVLHHVASLLWSQSCPIIWKVWIQFKGHFEKSNLDLCDLFQLISQKRYIVWWKFVWNTYSKAYMAFQFTL